MAIANWVQELSSTVGTGDITLTGPTSGNVSFQERWTTYPASINYLIIDGENKEIGLGTLVSATTLERTTIAETLYAGTLTVSGATPIELTGGAFVAVAYSAADLEGLGSGGGGGDHVKTDWNAALGSATELLNKPTLPTLTSELTNDSVISSLVAGSNVTIDTTDERNPVINATASGGGGGGGDVKVSDEGSQVLAAASNINFVGAGVTTTDGGAGTATVTIPGGGGGGGADIAIEGEGVELIAAAERLDFTGAHVSLSDAGSNEATITIEVPAASSIVPGTLSATHFDKLTGIADNATPDQTGAEIKTALFGEVDTNNFDDLSQTKLSGIAASAQVNRTAAQIKTDLFGEVDTNNFTDALLTVLESIETGAKDDQTGSEIKALLDALANTNLATDAQIAKLDALHVDYSLAPVQAVTDLKSITSATYTDKARVFVEDERSEYFYDAQQTSGDEAPNDQVGGTGFWLKISLDGETSASILAKYESNPNRQAFTDAKDTKLTGIEDGATADQTDTEIAALYEAVATVERFTTTFKDKLVAIEESATADQTGAEIKTALFTELDTNNFDNTAKDKLDGVESGATADQTDLEIAALYVAVATVERFTTTLLNKLNGIAEGAEVNVQADWGSEGADGVLNKPNLVGSLGSLTDVTAPSPEDGQALVWAAEFNDYRPQDVISSSSGGSTSTASGADITHNTFDIIANAGLDLAGDTHKIIDDFETSAGVNPTGSVGTYVSADDYYVGNDTGNGSSIAIEMTSNTAPDGTVTSDAVNSTTSWEVFDNNPNSDWNAGTDANTTDVIVEFEFSELTHVNGYMVHRDAGSDSLAPRSWILEGSKDGSSYDLLHTEVNADWTNFQTNSLGIIGTDEKYKFFRTTFTSQNGFGGMVLAQISFLGPNTRSIFDVRSVSQNTTIETTTAKLLVWHEDVVEDVILNTRLVGTVIVGSTIHTVTLAEVSRVGQFRLSSGVVTFAEEPIDTNIHYNINITNGTEVRIHGVALDWSGGIDTLTSADIKTLYEGEADTNVYDDAAVTKLSGIETSATADQTGAEIKTAYEGEANTNSFTDAEKTKLGTLSLARTDEEIYDLVGAMFTGNSESGITSTFDDGTDKINLTASGSGGGSGSGTADNSVSQANLAVAQIQQAKIRDYAAHGVIEGGIDAFIDTTGIDAAGTSGEYHDVAAACYSNTNDLVDLVPQQSSSLETAASSNGTTAWKVFNKNTADSWDATSTSGFIRFDFATATAIKEYRLRSSGNASAALGSWDIQASNDNSNWTVLDSVSGANPGVNAWVDYTIDSPQEFLYYALNIFSTAGGQNMSIAEWEMLGEAPAGPMVLVSNSYGASEQVDTCLLTIIIEDIDAGLILNDHLIAEVSRDGGTTWGVVTLQELSTNPRGRIIGEEIDVSSQPAGTDFRWRITSSDPGSGYKKFKVHGVSLDWSQASAAVITGSEEGTLITSMAGYFVKNWKTITAISGYSWSKMCWSEDLQQLCAVADTGGGRISTSMDGDSWNSIVPPTGNNWYGICYGKNQYVAVAYGGASDRVMTSPDGLTWTTRTPATAQNWRDIIYVEALDLYVAVGQANIASCGVMTSPDGVTWTTRTPAADNSWEALCYSEDLNLLVAVAYSGTGNRVMTSPDGINWTIETSAADNSWFDVVWAGGSIQKFFAVAYDGSGNNFMSSVDGKAWTLEAAPYDAQWLSVEYSPELDLLCATSYDGTGRIATSKDGVLWTVRSITGNPELRSCVWAAGLGVFIASADTRSVNLFVSTY
ncbi:MAG: hypothetical protein JKY34_10865 [Kordiimonadaceae bacterium]|nr:hypothetical protein [Kordiimonadaceae bacterium]